MDDWLVRRSMSIGGSDAPTILNGRIPLEFDPGFGSEVEIWSSKKLVRDHYGLGMRPQKHSEAMQRGHDAEPLCREFLGGQFNTVFTECFLDLYRRDDFPMLHGSIDGECIIDGKVYGLEIKTMGYNGSSWTSGPPARVDLQSRHNWFCRPSLDGFILAGFKAPEEVWRLVNGGSVSISAAVSRGSMKFWYKFLEPSDWYETTCVPVLADWWNRHVVDMVSPEPDHQKITKESIDEMFRSFEGDCDIEPEIEDLLAERVQVDAEVKELKARLGTINNRIKLFMKNKRVARNESYRVSLTWVETRDLDKKKLKEDMPELYEKYQKDSGHSRMTVTRSKDVGN